MIVRGARCMNWERLVAELPPLTNLLALTCFGTVDTTLQQHRDPACV